jgi:hypothetical protein
MRRTRPLTTILQPFDNHPGDIVTALCERECAEEFVTTLKNGKT